MAKKKTITVGARQTPKISPKARFAETDQELHNLHLQTFSNFITQKGHSPEERRILKKYFKIWITPNNIRAVIHVGVDSIYYHLLGGRMGELMPRKEAKVISFIKRNKK